MPVNADSHTPHGKSLTTVVLAVQFVMVSGVFPNASNLVGRLKDSLLSGKPMTQSKNRGHTPPFQGVAVVYGEEDAGYMVDFTSDDSPFTQPLSQLQSYRWRWISLVADLTFYLCVHGFGIYVIQIRCFAVLLARLQTHYSVEVQPRDFSCAVGINNIARVE